jgi:hypothetical protein
MVDNTANPLPQTTPARETRPPPRPRHRESWRDCDPVDPADVAGVRERLAKVTRVVFELTELDPSLLWKPERDRLRLLVDRILGPVGTEATGEAVNDLNALRRRGFPVRAFDFPRGERASRATSRAMVLQLRALYETRQFDAIAESLHVETTLDFLETRSRRR